jgi:hypothetical protein
MYYPATKRNLISLFALGLITLSFVGCQSLQVKNPGELAIENHAFISLWDTYNHCLTGSNTQEIQRNLAILHSAPKPISLDDSPIPVPNFLKKLSSTRNSRLAVDPRAMAASCSIHLGEIAYQSADWNMALRTFQTIVENYPEPQYAFYVSKATQAIEKFSSVLPVSLSSHDSLVR